MPGSRRERIAAFAALAALWALFVVQAWHTPALLDDWVQIGWYRGHDHTLDAQLVWRVARYNYLHGNPRIGDVFLLLVNGPRAVHLILTPVIELALLGLAFTVALGRWPRPSHRDAALALVLQVMIWLASPLPGVLYFYRPFTTNYLFAFAATLGLIAPYRVALAAAPVDGGAGGDAIGGGARRWAVAPIFALGWLAGMGNEHTGAAAIAAVAWLVAAAARRRRLRGWMLAGGLGLCTGYAMLLFAPGQAERYAGRAGRYDAAGLIASRGVAGCYEIVAGFLGEVQWPVVMMVAAALGFAVHHRRRGLAVPRMPRAALRAIAALCAGAGAIVATLFASPVAIERLLFAPAVLVACALAVVADHVFAVRRVRCALIAACAVIFAYHAVRFVAIYAAASAEHRRRIAALTAAAPGSVATVPPYRTPRSRWYFGDDFRMAAIREYVAHTVFGLDAIELAERPTWAEPTPAERFIAHAVYDPALPDEPDAPPLAPYVPSFLDAALAQLRAGLAVGGWDARAGRHLVRYQVDAAASPFLDPRDRPLRMFEWTPDGVRFVYGDGVENADHQPSIQVAVATLPAGWSDAFLVGCGRTQRVDGEPAGPDLVLPVSLDCRGSYTAVVCDPAVCWFAGRYWR